MEERSLHLLDYMSVVRRRRYWLLIPAALSIAVGALLALLLPREYKSSTTIAVTSPSMGSDLVKSTPADISERVRAISHDLLSRPVLERAAREEGLAAESSLDAAVASIRSRTTVEPAKTIAPSGRSGPDTFVVSYTGANPDITQRVTNKLATSFIEQHFKSRETRAEDTSAFLGTQLEQSHARLKEIEEKLRKVKEAYMGRLPEQTQANLQMVAGLHQQQESAAMSLRSEQDRLAMVERQIEAMRQGAVGSTAPRSAAGGQSAQERLLTLRRELDEASAMYTEKHPEIQRLKSEIASTEALAKVESTRPAAEREPALGADPTYRQLQAERETVRLRIRDHERSAARINGEIGRYQSRVDTAPMVEQQMSSLNREYELEKAQHNGLAERHQAAVLNEDLERRRAGEQFTVLYPAHRPSRPSSPDVVRIMVLAVLGGLVVGAALAFGREYLDRSVHEARALQTEFDLPVLAEIPHIGVR